METSVKAAKVLVPPQPSVASPALDEEIVKGKVGAAACDSSSDFFDPMMEFSRQLEDIISAHGSAATLLDKQSSVEAETEKMKEEAKDDVGVTTETEVSLIMQSLNKFSSPEEKLQDVVRKYAEQVALRRCDEQRLGVLQQLQAERHSSIMARAKLEALCRELQSHYGTLREETLQRCREDEEKRKEITGHFQKMLTEIQAQIEQHSARNDKLCRENSHLTDKLESLMNQCELREESLEKIERHRDLQHKLTEAKLQQANALLAEAEEKHKREKEYLLREAIEKTKKCFAMKEQELSMKKKLTLYAQKFDEFQVTLAKSNEIYARFKKEMDNMSDKMKKMEKESNLWKTRFENCNKALIDMMEERTEKGKEYDLFVLKIQRLEKLCHTLQEERRVLYSKIKEVHQAHSNPPSEVCQVAGPDAAGRSVLLSPMEVRELQEDDPVLTEDMARLREEQAKLQEFATTLLSTSATEEKEEEENKDLEPEEDLVTSAFAQFKTKPQVNKEPETVEEPQNVPKPEAPTPEEKAPEMTPTDLKPEKAKVQTRVEVEEEQQVEPDQQIPQQQTSRQEPAPEAGISKEPEQVEPAVPAGDGKLQHQPAELARATESPESTSESAPLPENTLAAPPSTADSSKKQAPKKKKKRGGKNSS